MRDFITIPEVTLYETKTKRKNIYGSVRIGKRGRIGQSTPVTWEEWTTIANGDLKLEGEEAGEFNCFFVGEQTRKMDSKKIVHVGYNLEENSMIVNVENRQKAMMFILPDAILIPDVYFLLTGEKIYVPEPTTEEKPGFFTSLKSKLNTYF